jgi:predicted nucleotidyltransferase
MISKPATARFLLRLPAPLRDALQSAASPAGVSLNEYCVRRLASGGGLSAHADAPVIATRAANVCGHSLVGVILYGSWARGTTHAGSDVDLLIVVDRPRGLTRALYRAWDARPVTWEGRPVDPHFVHLPAEGRVASGVWAEAALDGVVLFEADLRISMALGRVRHDIAAGRLLRRVASGQPYWVAA